MAAKFCQEFGINQILLEGDALWVVIALKKEMKDWIQIRLLIKDTKATLNFS